MFLLLLFQNESATIYSFVEPATVPITLKQRIPTQRLRKIRYNSNCMNTRILIFYTR